MAKKTLINAIINLLNQSFQDDNRVTLSNDIEKRIIQTFKKLANATMKLTDVNEQIIDLCLNNIQKEKENVNRVSENFVSKNKNIRRFTQKNISTIRQINNIIPEKNKEETIKSTGATNILKDAAQNTLRSANNVLSREIPYYNILKNIIGTIGTISKVLLPTKTNTLLSNNPTENTDFNTNIVQPNKYDNLFIGMNNKPLSETKVMNNSIAGIAVKYLFKKITGQEIFSEDGFGLSDLMYGGGLLGLFKSIFALPKRMFNKIKGIFKSAYKFIRHPIRSLKNVQRWFKLKQLQGTRKLRSLISQIKKIPTRIKNLPKSLSNIPSSIFKKFTPKFLRNKSIGKLLGRFLPKFGKQAAGRMLSPFAARGVGMLGGSVTGLGGLLLNPVTLAVLGAGYNLWNSKDTASALGKNPEDISFFDKATSTIFQMLTGNTGDNSFSSKLQNALTQAAIYGSVGAVAGGGIGAIPAALIGGVLGWFGGDNIAKGIVGAKDKILKGNKKEVEKDRIDETYKKSKKTMTENIKALDKFNKNILGDTTNYVDYMYKGAAKYSDLKRFLNKMRNTSGANTYFNTDNLNDVLKANYNLNQKKIESGQLDVSNIEKYIDLSKVSLENLLHTNPVLLENLLKGAEEYYQKTGKKLAINEAARSYEQQKALYMSGKYKAAKPGTSKHEKGLAVDVSVNRNDFDIWLEIAKKFNLYQGATARGVSGEEHHFELTDPVQKIAVELANNELDTNAKTVVQTPQPNLAPNEENIAEIKRKQDEKNEIAEQQYEQDIIGIGENTVAQMQEKPSKQYENGFRVGINNMTRKSVFSIDETVYETVFGTNIFAV